MPVHSEEIPGGETLLRFEGKFEASDAGRVREALSEARDGAPVVLDFSQVRHIEDFAIALIAPDLMAAGGPRVRLRGLGPHQRRILEYFGVARARPAEGSRRPYRGIGDVVKARA